ncbi:MAG: isoprenylcysteine carboxylmethyltransferase family protein [Vicinamibacterales bacterium]
MTLALLIATVVPMVIEAGVAARHDRALRARGAIEPAEDVFGLMQLAYPGAFVAMIAEGWSRGAQEDPALVPGVVLFLLAKGLKYWAIATLGGRWTFRVLVPPGSTRIVDGPYRYLRHPNYVAVIGELAAVALMANARVTGPIATCLFLVLIVARVRIEERALAAR